MSALWIPEPPLKHSAAYTSEEAPVVLMALALPSATLAYERMAGGSNPQRFGIQ